MKNILAWIKKNGLQSSLIIISLLGILGISIANSIIEFNTAPLSSQSSGTREDITASRIMELVNVQRTTAGLPALITDPRAMQAAQIKCDDMVANNYYDHVNPKTGKHGYQYAIDLIPEGKLFNENLNKGDVPTNLEFVNSWLNSQAHKETMLDSRYTHTGVAVCKLPTEPENSLTLVQMFVSIAPPEAKSDKPVGQVNGTNTNCVTFSIPRSTEYKDASWLDRGTTQTWQGMDGSRVVCGTQTISNISPVNNITYTGTYTPPQSNAQIGPSTTSEDTAARQAEYEQAVAACVKKIQRLSPNSDAYKMCYHY